MTFDNLVSQINEMAETQRDRGTYFEYLARAYFQNEPTYQNEFKGTSKNTSRASRASNLSLIYSLFLVNFCL